ncbi:JmjC domain-containing protein [Actinokineospora iranica]|uniref:Cupin superfamily protein n=1 Tax=Actinokineospora iranica TaxID=1271860 RepID=A0A1G6K2T9_9PSEU|nr:cupin domain-containing protein [Actinokineospora iranica]SDC24935.1 Cupin superfamily protein [Actinokineospora iranica]
MKHLAVELFQIALGWDGPQKLGREFALGHLGDTGLCSRLLTPSKLLDVVMRRSLAAPQIRCLQNGTDLSPDSYMGSQINGMPMVDMQAVGRLLRSGCTIVLDAVDLFDPTMEVACRALQWWSHELVQVNCYLTTGSAPGFPLHWDDHDVLIVQLSGEKTWEVRGPSRVAPLYRDAEPNTAPSANVIWSGSMLPGDVMHIPRGHWHQATRTDRADGHSLHATFGITKRTGVDWLLWLADHSREHELFRHDLDRWDTKLEGQPNAAQLEDEFEALRKRFTPDTYLSSREHQQRPSRHVATHNVFGPPTSVVCVTDFPPDIKPCGDTIEVLAVGKRLTFAARAEPALRRLLSGHPETIEQVGNDTGLDATILAETLVEEGLCAELTDELAAGYQGLVTGLDRPTTR